MDKLDDIRKNIQKAIEDSKMSRLKVTEKAGISYQHLTRFLNNNTGGEIGLGILSRLSEALNVPVGYLLGETDKEGGFFLCSGEKRLPEELDKLMKEILEMSPEEQDKVCKILRVFIDTLKK